MKLLFILISLFVSAQVLAASKTTKMATPSTSITHPIDIEKSYTLEPSMTFSSMASGTQFLSVALTGRINQWLRLGVEGDLPMTFQDDSQIFEAKGFGRFSFLDDTNKVYAQVAAVLGVFSQAIVGSQGFVGGEATVGYARPVDENWLIGARIGAQVVNFNYNREFQTINKGIFTAYNRFTIYASYVF